VRFVGEVSEDEKWRLLRRARLLVAPSLGGESFGIVLLEAMAAGAAPIAADNPGYRGVLASHADDMLFAPGNATALTNRIREIFGDGAKRGMLQTWGMEYAAQFYWSALAPRVEAEYERAIAGSRGATGRRAWRVVRKHRPRGTLRVCMPRDSPR
jgi:phosphatidyl-myo-inositol alpha-mannosyltransferase